MNMAQVREKAKELLQASGLRRTKGRIEVLAILIKATKPLSHNDIMKRLAGRIFDRVSVYRCLDRFVAGDIVHKAYVAGRNDMFEIASRCGEDYCHPHFLCRRCKETFCMMEVSVPVLKNLGGGFVPIRQQIHIEGLCPECGGKRS